MLVNNLEKGRLGGETDRFGTDGCAEVETGAWDGRVNVEAGACVTEHQCFGQVDVNLHCGFTGPNEAKGGVDALTFVPSL